MILSRIFSLVAVVRKRYLSAWELCLIVKKRLFHFLSAAIDLLGFNRQPAENQTKIIAHYVEGHLPMDNTV
jgi:hypothetical protein